jgi:hypothetical protein
VDDEPSERNGKGTPVSGIRDIMARRFMQACIIIQEVIPVASNLEKTSGAF